jgi:hypothetical protein
MMELMDGGEAPSVNSNGQASRASDLRCGMTATLTGGPVARYPRLFALHPAVLLAALGSGFPTV